MILLFCMRRHGGAVVSVDASQGVGSIPDLRPFYVQFACCVGVRALSSDSLAKAHACDHATCMCNMGVYMCEVCLHCGKVFHSSHVWEKHSKGYCSRKRKSENKKITRSTMALPSFHYHYQLELKCR